MLALIVALLPFDTGAFTHGVNHGALLAPVLDAFDAPDGVAGEWLGLAIGLIRTCTGGLSGGRARWARGSNGAPLGLLGPCTPPHVFEALGVFAEGVGAEGRGVNPALFEGATQFRGLPLQPFGGISNACGACGTPGLEECSTDCQRIEVASRRGLELSAELGREVGSTSSSVDRTRSVLVSRATNGMEDPAGLTAEPPGDFPLPQVSQYGRPVHNPDGTLKSCRAMFG